MQLRSFVLRVVCPPVLAWDSVKLSYQAACLVVRGVQRVVEVYGAEGPFPSGGSAIGRFVQRLLIDSTRKDIFELWTPLDSGLEVSAKRSSDNGHAVAGAARDAVRRALHAAVDSRGYSRYEISASAVAFDDPKCRGWQVHYAVNDLKLPARADWPTDSDAIVGIDIDYYLRDPSILLGWGRPVALYTFQPLAVAGKDGDCSFTIKDDVVEYVVGGGGNWNHKVWDWCAPGEFSVVDAQLPYPFSTEGVVHRLLSIIGLRKKVYHKLVFARPFSKLPHRAVVWAVPQFTHWAVTWLHSDLHARTIKRVSYSSRGKPGWNVMQYADSKGDNMVSFGPAGSVRELTMPKADFDTLMGLASSQSVTSRMIGMGYRETSDLALLGQYYRGAEPNVEASRVVSTKPCAPFVHHPLASHAEVPKTNFRALGAPIVSDQNLVPAIQRWETASQAVDQRITYHTNNSVPPKRFQNYAREFLQLLVPEEGVGVPYSLEETRDLLDKPSQALAVRAIWDSLDMRARRLIELFVKNEPTNKAGRVISSFADARFLLVFSAYTLRFRDKVLSHEDNAHWFMPGRPPGELAGAVMRYVSSVDQVVEGDYSNYDGSVSAWAQRNVMSACYHRWFDSSFLKDLSFYTDMLISCPARSKSFGFHYEPGPGVKSGSPTTCDLNTVLNAFVQYCAVRMTDISLSPYEAYQEIGLAFGDDSLFSARYSRAWVSAASHLGLTLAVEPANPEMGVCFLARVFPDPWETITSFQDPLRTWRKAHLTARNQTVPLEDAAVDKMTGYLTSDSLSPVTGAYARMIIRCYDTASGAEKRIARSCFYRDRPYWSTIGGPWPQQEKDVDLMFRCTAARTGFDVEQIRELDHQLSDQVNDPWAPFTLNREEEAAPWANTLDPEGLPVGEVDPRALMYENEQISIRANPEHTRMDRDLHRGGRGRHPGNRGGKPSQPANAGGSREPPSLPAPSPPEGGQHGEKQPVEASPRGGGKTGRGRRRGTRRGKKPSPGSTGADAAEERPPPTQQPPTTRGRGARGGGRGRGTGRGAAQRTGPVPERKDIGRDHTPVG